MENNENEREVPQAADKEALDEANEHSISNNNTKDVVPQHKEGNLDEVNLKESDGEGDTVEDESNGTPTDDVENQNSNSIQVSNQINTGQTNTNENGTDSKEATPCHKKIWNWWCQAYGKYSFLILVLCAVLLALAYPPLGAIYLAPQITATWIAVIFIFVLSGLGLKTEEFKNAFKQIKFNAFVQVFNFFVDSSIVFGISRALYRVGALSLALADGMTISSSLPLTISMVMALTVSSNGDEAAAVFNAAFGNMIGIFLTPLIVLMYLGAEGSISLGSVFLKLALRVILPIVVGQLLQKFCPPVVAFVKKHKPRFKKLQEWALVYIVYCTFCKTFLEGTDATLVQVFTMIAVLICIIPMLMVLAWYSLGFCFPNQPKLRVMGLFGCTHKTVAMGVPLINAIYETNPLVGLYTLPVLIWHPMQLFIGTFLAPRLSDYVDRETERLMKKSSESENANKNDDDNEHHDDFEANPNRTTTA